MKTKKIMIALMLLTTGTAWAEDFPKDSLKIVDIEEVVVIATPKENRKLRDLPVAATVLSQDNMRANQFTHQYSVRRTLCRQYPLYRQIRFRLQLC